MDIPLPKSIIAAGHYHQEAGCEPEFRTIWPGVELVELVTGGRGWVQTGGQWVEVTPGALLWHIPGDVTIARSDWNDPYRCLAVTFETESPTIERRLPHLSWWRDRDEGARFTREVVAAHVDDPFDRQALLVYTFGRLLFQVRQWQRTGTRSELPEKLRHALEIVENQWVPLPEVARQTGWSVAHLHEIFRQHLGATPHEIALRRRMQLARERLAATDQPVKQIAADCGFATPAAFCHAFKARIGLTPMDYRRRETK